MNVKKDDPLQGNKSFILVACRPYNHDKLSSIIYILTRKCKAVTIGWLDYNWWRQPEINLKLKSRDLAVIKELANNSNASFQRWIGHVKRRLMAEKNSLPPSFGKYLWWLKLPSPSSGFGNLTVGKSGSGFFCSSTSTSSGRLKTSIARLTNRVPTPWTGV